MPTPRLFAEHQHCRRTDNLIFDLTGLLHIRMYKRESDILLVCADNPAGNFTRTHIRILAQTESTLPVMEL